jgi:hypothetical protein
MPLLKHRYTDVAHKVVTKYTINRKDLLQLDNLYLLMHEWLIEHNYVTRNDADFPEKYYLHKDSPAGKEIWWRWRPTRWPISGNQRWRFDLDIDVHVLMLKDAEAVINGKKFKAQSGEVEVAVAANLIEDPTGQLQKSVFKDFKKMLYTRMWKQQAKMLEDELYRESLAFRDAINTFLTIETYLPTKEWPEFWPKRVPE